MKIGSTTVYISKPDGSDMEVYKCDRMGLGVFIIDNLREYLFKYKHEHDYESAFYATHGRWWTYDVKELEEKYGLTIYWQGDSLNVRNK